jgi:hypothetical protein
VGPTDTYPDEHVAALARLYREHPAWRAAAARLHEQSTSGVWFRHRPGEAWHLAREDGETRLRPGRVEDPDFMFRFSPASIVALGEAGSRIDDFAVRLFELMLDPDEERRIGFRIVASFGRLLRRGYVRLLLEAGPRVAAFAASHGVTGLRAIRNLVVELARREPQPWERHVADPEGLG